MSRYQEFRAGKDAFFAKHAQSPLTPPENRLKVPIRAGEKIFKK